MVGLTTRTRPYICQLTALPVFKGRSDKPFLCHQCGHLLVDGYEPRALIAVDIECFKCKSITTTDPWPDNGEPLPQPLVTLGDRGRFNIGSPVDINDRVAMSCDQEIARVLALTGPRPRSDSSWQFFPESLHALETDVNLLTSNAFAKLKARAELARASGNQAFGPTKAAPVWAVTHLRAAMATRRINLDGPDGVALSYIQTLRDSLHRWREHPHFDAIASSLCNEFHHTLAALTIASYLHDVGNHIGITKADHRAGRSPDLFVNAGRDDRLSIEVKCPQSFFFPAEPPGVDEIARRMEREIKDARGQITGKDGGIVVIGAGHFAPSFHAALKQALGDICKRGRVSSRVALVAVVAFMKPSIGRSPTGEPKLDSVGQIFTEQNPRFPGVNPIDTGPAG